VDLPRASPPSLDDLSDAGPEAALDAAGTEGLRITNAVMDGLERTGVT
jgi:hypothetical protein